MKSFWKQLKNVQAGPNTLGQINLVGQYLQAQLDEYPYIEIGIIRVEAKLLTFGAAGYALDKTDGYGPNVAEVYWLPWKNYESTVAARQAFENKADVFFMTSTLTGCRFTVDQDLVVHTANMANGGRTASEEEQIGGRTRSTRRLSVSRPTNPNDKRYGGRLIGAYTRALVFGMKIQDRYSYKVLDTHTDTWDIIL